MDYIDSFKFNLEFKRFKQQYNYATIVDFIEKKLLTDFDLNDSNIYYYHVRNDRIYELKESLKK